MRDYVRPIPISDPADLPGALPLAGGWARFTHAEVLRRGRPPEIVAVDALSPGLLDTLTAPRAAIGGIDFDRPRLMGILNLTPDSFSDGGQHAVGTEALDRARALVSEGADILDIGGESTRPGAQEVPEAEEIARVRPVIEALAADGPSVPLSLDTRKSGVARAGLAAGADWINDVSGLRFDPALARVAAESGAPLVLMHSIGTPGTMQAAAATAYEDVLLDVYDALEAAVAVAVAAGVPRRSIIVDPGIGFGKTDPQNRALLARIGLFHGLGLPILLGASRKGMIGRIAGVADASRRGPGSAGIGLWAVSQGVQILRVHDMEMHRQAISLWQACAAPAP
ncbi:dihydropteroate synthase [Roseibacterium sp. SDUM158016]|uniref:dihydropteroate synthase n=1 Tax=Roseicyclus sediminis TaxID=2980997 RepID=UPI0021D20F8C|nr:dihydropteroate synthase [Roseibacterium sp. SDUM158016]MCU4652914.1 dihydropteroate synthase [Roseibacterium sp. SDUM158016]